jgi:gluconolactonase
MMQRLMGWCVTLVVLSTTGTAADRVFTPAGPVEELWNSGEFTEGVATRTDGVVFFSDIAIAGKNPGRIMTFDPRTKMTSVFVADSGQSNGLFFAPNGTLYAACGAMHGLRAVCEVTAAGKMVPVVQDYQGKVFNAPNDLAVHSRGWIYFSDPRYVGPEPLELDHQSVYRIDPNGALLRVTNSITKPNGVIISPDGQTLYVAETDNGATGVEPAGTAPQPARYTLNAFPIRTDGSLGDKRMLVDFGTEAGVDGMTMDTTGRIYAAIRIPSRQGIGVYGTDGKELDFLVTKALPTNCTFGRGEEQSTLYITAGSGLYRTVVHAEGFHP